MVQLLWKIVHQFFKNLNVELPCNQAILLLGMYPKEFKAGPQTIAVFMAALFTVAKRWKQPKCPSEDEWINKLWCLHTVEYYSAIKRNKILIYISQHGWT